MAPQNSTLIHEHVESTTTELSRYSPILPPTTEEDTDNNDDDNTSQRKKSIFSQAIDIQEENEIPIWICGEPRFISGITCKTTCYDIIQALIDDELHNHDGKNTQANDVAASRDRNDYVITEKWRDVEQALTGETRILPIWEAWGNARNEVKFKLKINKNKDGQSNSNCKDIKKKERKNKKGVVSTVLKKLLRQSETIVNYISVLREARTPYDVRNRLDKNMLMDNFLKDIVSSASSEPRIVEELIVNKNAKGSLSTISQPDDDDELFLLIDNSSVDGINRGDSGIHVEYRQYMLNQKLHASQRASKSKLLKLTNQKKFIETPKRKHRSKQYFEQLRNRCLYKKFTSSQDIIIKNHLAEMHIPPNRLKQIRFEILLLIDDLNNLFKYEKELMLNLSKCSAQYHAENELYTTKLGLQMCIENIQANLEIYGKEIVQNEFKLFKTKIEIEQKREILNKLKQILNNEEENKNCNDINRLRKILPNEIFTKSDKTQNIDIFDDVEFVDNIYEFCDFNKSMVV